MKTYRSSKRYTLAPDPISAQGHVERIKDVEQQCKTQSLDNMVYDTEGNKELCI